MNVRIWLLAATIGLAGAATVQSQTSDGPERGRSHWRTGHAANLFISPCGKPFRSAPGGPDPVEAWFRETDTNHDGYLERSELRAEAAAFFAVLDVNHDGVIDPSEVDIYEQRIAPEILRRRLPAEAAQSPRFILAQFGGGGGGGGGGRSRGRRQGGNAQGATPQAPQSEMVGAAPYNLFAEPEPVTAADMRFNGRITLEEFLAAADRHFDALDVHQNGKIAFSDLPKTQAQIAGPHGRSE